MPRGFHPFYPVLALVFSVSGAAISLQDKPAQTPPHGGAVIRVGVGLVQTDVMVFDRQGRFVDDLTANEFEVQVDGKPQNIDFFQLISEGGPVQAAAAPKDGSPTAAPLATGIAGSESGRTLLFFADDWHLSADGVIRVRKTLESLIDKNMGPNDRGAIFPASRQIGFLQQLMENKTVLKLAVARLNFMNGCVQDLGRPPMSEAQTVAIEQNDPDILAYFVEQTVAAENLQDIPQLAVDIVRRKASALAQNRKEYL